MDNKEFRNEVYKKYNYYKNVKNDKFYNKPQYSTRLEIRKYGLNYVATFILVSLLISGVVYATSQYIKTIWKEPERYFYNDEKTVTEDDKKMVITEEEAKEIGISNLRKLNNKIGEVTTSYLNKEPSTNKIEWVIETDNNLEIRINAQNGEIYSFTNNELLNQTRNYIKSKEEAIAVAKEIYKDLEYEKKYELVEIKRIGQGKWEAYFSVKYNGIFNDYQSIRITFFTETKELIMLNIFDYDFENNPFEITEEIAINIVENKYGENNIKEISAKKDIRQMNTIMYQKENSLQDGEYRISNIVRNVWNVKVVDKQNEFVEYYYVDATTGEIIGGNQIK